MWTIVCFDLPTEKPKHKKAYVRFRRELLAMGFSMLQYSVYARFAASDEIDKAVRGQICDVLPEWGQVRVLSLTDRQFEKQALFVGKIREKVESAPQQILLF